MSLLHDLDDYKLATSFEKDPECVLHTSYKADRARGIRKVKVIEKWAPQKPELGVGTFGIVRLEKRLGHQSTIGPTYRAVKQLRKSHLAQSKIDYTKELLALTKFSRSKFSQHEIFIEFFGWFEDEEYIFLAMEYFPRGTLDMFINKDMKESDARMIAVQLLEGLKIMHEEGFTHRDLKPKNIFVVEKSPWWVKIGDFGITKRVSNNETALHTATGTPHYLAPEVLHYVDTEDDESDVYTNAVDIWSFACVVYEMMALQVPFPKHPRNLLAFCRGGPFPEKPLFQRTSKEGIEFIKTTLVPLPTLRPPAKEALEAQWLHIKDEKEFSQVYISSDVDLIPEPSSYTYPERDRTTQPLYFEDEPGFYTRSSSAIVQDNFLPTEMPAAVTYHREPSKELLILLKGSIDSVDSKPDLWKHFTGRTIMVTRYSVSSPEKKLSGEFVCILPGRRLLLRTVVDSTGMHLPNAVIHPENILDLSVVETEALRPESIENAVQPPTSGGRSWSLLEGMKSILLPIKSKRATDDWDLTATVGGGWSSSVPDRSNKTPELQRPSSSSQAKYDWNTSPKELETTLEAERKRQEQSVRYTSPTQMGDTVDTERKKQEKSMGDKMEEASQKYGAGQFSRTDRREEPVTSPRPTWTKMSRRHLSIETLNEYQLEFSFDEDPEYVLIKRWVPEYEQDFLWSHTKKIREERRSHNANISKQQHPVNPSVTDEMHGQGTTEGGPRSHRIYSPPESKLQENSRGRTLSSRFDARIRRSEPKPTNITSYGNLGIQIKFPLEPESEGESRGRSLKRRTDLPLRHIEPEPERRASRGSPSAQTNLPSESKVQENARGRTRTRRIDPEPEPKPAEKTNPRTPTVGTLPYPVPSILLDGSGEENLFSTKRVQTESPVVPLLLLQSPEGIKSVIDIGLQTKSPSVPHLVLQTPEGIESFL